VCTLRLRTFPQLISLPAIPKPGIQGKESIRYYDPIVHKNGGEQLLNVPAIVLANLCVSYIMTSQNEAAEELMRKIEKEEERLAFPDQRSVHHLCIVNLVIGTLYCAKGNFEFGIARIVKSLEPYDKKLGADTWYVPKQLEKRALGILRAPDCPSRPLCE